MTVTIRYAKPSPYVRKVLVFATEAGLRETLTLEPADPWAADTDLAKDNPIGKVPAMRTPDGVFIGSFACCDWLDQQHGGAALIPRRGAERWRVMQLYGLADGVLDAALAAVVERLRRPHEWIWQGWIDRQEAKIRAGLAALEQRADELRPIDIASITTGCMLGYLDFRFGHFDWRAQTPKLAAFYEEFSKRPSMQATRPD